MAKHPNWTIPNVLTMIRILLTPGIVMAFAGHHMELVWIIFGLAGLTDALDGFLARVLDQRSSLGAMLDPLADKILLGTSYICLGLRGWVPAWLVVIVVSRDLIIVGGLTLLSSCGVDVRGKINPSMVSKCNTAAQIFLVATILLARTFVWELYLLELFLVVTVAVLTLTSGFHYVVKGITFFTEDDI